MNYNELVAISLIGLFVAIGYRLYRNGVEERQETILASAEIPVL